ncbi:hypothetical protein A3K80_09225 [Candidatus Bathyarchaeota archaeon RBG_13_38_9]|nr:MAG: hypothetical protein A3K80_09225 [Candidatus Bathyarchaeota archaeon RBG_13_38_9]
MEFDSKEVRIIMVKNEPWFIAKDISDILDFSEPSAMTRTLDDDEKGLHNVQTLGGVQSLQIINESGLYSSILRSRLPKAKRFKKWVTAEVLPTIRKTGEYSVANPPLLPDFNDPVAAARAWADAKEEELKAKKNLLEAKPKIEFYDKVGDSKGLHTVAKAAKLLGTGRNRLFSWMRTYKILRANNEPYQKYIEAGYFEVKENPAGDYLNAQTFVTPTGLQWLQKCRDKNRVEVMEWAEKNDIKV